MRFPRPRPNLVETGGMNNDAFITTGDVARALGCPLHRVTYAVQRFMIREDMRVGGHRLYRRERLAEIAELLQRLNGDDRCSPRRI